MRLWAWSPPPPQVHVNEFSSAVKSAGAFGLRRYRLVKELLRYGVDAFSFVENEYYQWVGVPRALADAQSTP